MAKADVVAAQISAVQSGQLQVLSDGLGACYDQGATDQKASDGTFGQADIDSAVAKAVSDQQGLDAQALSDAQAKAQSDLDAVNKSLADMTAKEQMEEQAVAAVQASIQQVQASFDAIKALLVPAQAPAADPAPSA